MNPLLDMAQAAALRDVWLAADDEHFLRDCTFDFHKTTGPGGQKKNKTSSAVRLIHRPTQLQATAGEERDQHINRMRALRRLRLELALELRCENIRPWSGAWDMNPKNPQYPIFVACLLDVLHAKRFAIAEAAAFLGQSTAQLVKALARSQELWQHVHHWRQRLGLPPLRHPG